MSKTLVITKTYHPDTMTFRYQARVTLEMFQSAEVEDAVGMTGFEVEAAVADVMLKKLKRDIQEFDEIRIERITDDDS